MYYGTGQETNLNFGDIQSLIGDPVMEDDDKNKGDMVAS